MVETPGYTFTCGAMTIRSMMKKTQTKYSHIVNTRKTRPLLHPTLVHCLFERLFCLDSVIIFLRLPACICSSDSSLLKLPEFSRRKRCILFGQSWLRQHWRLFCWNDTNQASITWTIPISKEECLPAGTSC